MTQSSEEVAYDVAMRRLESQLQRVDVIENKVGIILGLSATVIGIFAGFIVVVVDPDEPASLVFAAIFGGIILAAYLLTMKSALATLATGDWDDRPNWDELLVSANELDLPVMHLWVAEGCVMSLKENEPKVKQKAEAAALATRLALANAILVAAALIVLFVVI